MSPTPSFEPQESGIRLLPHQQAFVEAVYGPGGSRITMLQSAVGFGRSTALVAAAARMVNANPVARVLFLTPRALAVQVVSRATALGVPSILVDRYRFRELLDASQGTEPWPSGELVVMSLHLAGAPDVLDALARTHWDLVIADEAHLYSGARGRILARLAPSSGRVLLAATPSTAFPAGLAGEDSTIVRWRREDILDHQGRSLGEAPRPVLDEVTYTATPVESSLQQSVSDLAAELIKTERFGNLAAQVLLGAAASSPAALERALQGLLAPSRVTSAPLDDDENSDEACVNDDATDTQDSQRGPAIIRAAEQALLILDGLATDSKLEALCTYLRPEVGRGAADSHVCIVTEFRATLFYVAAALEELRIKCQPIHGSMSLDQRAAEARQFADTGGVLLATRAALPTGAFMDRVTDLVLFDTPSSNAAAAEFVAQFDRVGRQRALSIHILVARQELGPTAGSAARLLAQALDRKPT